MNDYTEATIRQLERYVRKLYRDAEPALKRMAAEMLGRMKQKDAELRKQAKDGKITEKEARSRMAAFVSSSGMPGARKMALEILRVNKLAKERIDEAVPDVFAYAMNHASYEIETEIGADAGLVPVSKADVEDLFRKIPDLFGSRKMDEAKEKAYSVKKIIGNIISGFLEGFDLETIGDNIVKIIQNLNIDRWLQNIFDIITGADGGGEDTTNNWAQDNGVQMEKEWLATLDFKTRDTHRRLDGTRVPVDNAWEIDGEEIRYPRDPMAVPALRCNCRCTMRRVNPRFTKHDMRRENIKNENGEKPMIPWTDYQHWFEDKKRQYGEEEINRMIREMKQKQAHKYYVRRKRRQKEGGA